MNTDLDMDPLTMRKKFEDARSYADMLKSNNDLHGSDGSQVDTQLKREVCGW